DFHRQRGRQALRAPKLVGVNRHRVDARVIRVSAAHADVVYPQQRSVTNARMGERELGWFAKQQIGTDKNRHQNCSTRTLRIRPPSVMKSPRPRAISAIASGPNDWPRSWNTISEPCSPPGAPPCTGVVGGAGVPPARLGAPPPPPPNDCER